MFSKRAKLLVLSAACSVSVEALAAGLGEIRWFSALNEPLEAEIEVIFADPRDLPEYSVAVVPNSEYVLASGHMSAIVSALQSELIESGRRVIIRLHSRGPVREPFLNFRVSLTTPDVRLLRDYTVLLDPPYHPRKAGLGRVSAPAETAAPADPRPRSRPAPQAADAPPAVPQARGSSAVARQYGPTRRGDTLWAIARRVRRDRGVAIPAMVDALHRANPHAFIRGDANLLKVGVVLNVPVPAVGGEVPAPSPETASSTAAPSRERSAGVEGHTEPRTGGLDYRFTVVEHSGDWRYAAPLGAWSESDIARAVRYAAASLLAAEIELSALTRGAAEPLPGKARPSPPATRAAPAPAKPQPAATATGAAAAVPADPPLWKRWLLGWAAAGLLLLYVLRTHRRQRLLEEELEALRRRERKRQRRTALPEATRDGEHELTRQSFSEVPQAEQSEPPATTPEPEQAPPAPQVIVRPEEAADEVTVIEPPPAEVETIVAAAPPAEAASAPVSEAEEDLYNEIDLYIAYGRYERAAEIIRRALDENPDRCPLKLRLAEVYYRTRQPEKFTRLAQELKAVLEPPLWAKIQSMGENLLREVAASRSGETGDENTQLIEDDLPQPDIGSLTDELEKMGISELPFGDSEQETDEIDYSKFERARFLK